MRGLGVGGLTLAHQRDAVTGARLWGRRKNLVMRGRYGIPAPIRKWGGLHWGQVTVTLGLYGLEGWKGVVC